MFVFSGPCKTVKGKPCKFPFVYKGKNYEKCTDQGSDGNFWCSTKVEAGNVHAYGNFGYCAKGCPTQTGKI